MAAPARAPPQISSHPFGSVCLTLHPAAIGTWHAPLCRQKRPRHRPHKLESHSVHAHTQASHAIINPSLSCSAHTHTHTPHSTKQLCTNIHILTSRGTHTHHKLLQNCTSCCTLPELSARLASKGPVVVGSVHMHTTQARTHTHTPQADARRHLTASCRKEIFD